MIVGWRGTDMRNKNIIKRICAGALTVLIAATSIPVDAWASPVSRIQEVEIEDVELDEEEATEAIETVGDSSEEAEKASSYEEEEQLEAVDTYEVTIDVKNIKSFRYAIINDINTGETLNIKTATVTGDTYSITGVNKDKYIAVIDVDPMIDCDTPVIERGLTAVDTRTVVGTVGSTQQYGWNLGQITADTNDISIKCSQLYTVTISTENIATIKYKTYRHDAEYLVIAAEKSATPSAGVATFKINAGDSLAITDIVLANTDDFNDAVVSKNGSTIEMNENIGQSSAGAILSGWDIGVIDSAVDFSIISKAKEYCNVTITLENVTAIECTIYIKEDDVVKSSYKVSPTISDNKAIVSVPKDSYLAITSVSKKYDNLTVEKGTLEVPPTDITGVGSGYNLDKITAAVEDVKVISAAPTTTYPVNIKVTNIKSVEYVLYTDKNNITSDCLYSVNESAGIVSIDVPKDCFVAIRSDKIIKADGDLLDPVVLVNGVEIEEATIGTYKANGVSSELKGYNLGKVTSDTVATSISGGTEIVCNAPSYKVNITALKAKDLTYTFASDDQYSLNKTTKTATVIKDAVTIDVPTGYYLAINAVTPNDGCYGDTIVTVGGKPVTPKTISTKQYYEIGKVTKEISDGIIAQIDEKFYDVTINVAKASQIKYVVSSDINKVNSTVQTVAVSDDDKVTVKVEKEKYFVITDFILPDGKTKRSKAVVTKDKGTANAETFDYAEVGKYSSGTVLRGWNLGKVLNTMPLVSQKGEESYKITADCDNYCMYITEKVSDNLTVAYKSGYTSEVVSGKTRYYVKITDDGSSIKATDLTVYIEDNNGKPYEADNVFVYGYNEYTGVSSESDKITLTGASGVYTIPNDKIVKLSRAPEQYTTLILDVAGQKTVTFPNATDNSVKTYEYKNTITSLAEYSSESEISTQKVDYNKSFQFVVIPADASKFDIGTVTKKLGNATLDKHTDPNGIEYYQLSNVKSDVTVEATLKTKSTATLNYNVKNSSANKEAIFNSSNSQKTAVVDPLTDKYSVNAGVTDVQFTVTVDKAIEPTVSFKKSDDSVAPPQYVGKTTDSLGRDVYSYKIPAKDINGGTITITTTGVTKATYIQCKDNEVKLVVTYNGGPVAETGSGAANKFKPGYTIHQYDLPYGKDVIVQAIAKENCKLTNAAVNTKTVNYGVDGKITYKVNGENNKYGNDFVINSQALVTLYATDDGDSDNIKPVDKNAYVVPSVKKNNKNYMALIKDGTAAIEVRKKDNSNDASYTGAYYEAKVGSTVVSDDLISVDSFDGVNALMKFNFENANIAGKTVTVTITRNKATIATLKFTVTPYATMATLAGNKNNALTQEYLTKKVYKVQYNSGVAYEDVAFQGEYYDITSGTWKSFVKIYYDNTDSAWKVESAGAPTGSENLITYDAVAKSIVLKADKDTLEAMATAAGYAEGGTTGLPRIRINFYDVTYNTYDSMTTYVGNFVSKEFTFTMNTLRGITPTVSLASASDTALYLNLTAPKQYAGYEGMYYVIKAEAVDSDKADFPTDKLNISADMIVPMSDTSAKLVVAKDDTPPGEGAAWKYNVTVTLKSLNYSSPTINNTYGASKDKVLKNLSTKNPYYETKIAASAKTNKVYQRQKGVQIATAKFNSKTTYYDLTLKLYKKGETPESGSPVVTDADKLSQGTDPTKIMFDADTVEPGNYTLYVWPEASTAYATYATVPVVVYESIKGKTVGGRDATFEVDVPSITMYRKDGTAASMTVKPKYSNKPQTNKVIWKIENADGATSGYDITKYVTINSAGKITINKNFVYSKTNPNDNKFKVYAVAADYVSDPERESTKVTISMVRYPSEVTGLSLYKGDSPVEPSVGNKYLSEQIDGIKISGLTTDDCSIKSSNTKVIEVTRVKAGKDGYDFKVNGVGKARLTVTCNDGGKSSKYIDVQIINKKYDSGLGILVESTQAISGGEIDNSAEVAIVKVNDGSSLLSSDMTSYSLKVKSGGKLYAKAGDPNKFDLVPTAAKTTLVLVDNTRTNKEPKYSQTFVINNTFFGTKENLRLSLTKSAFKPAESSVLKITGIDKDTTDSYSVKFVSDYADDAKNPGKYGKLETALAGNTKLVDGTGVSLSYDSSLRAFVPGAADNMSFKTGTEYGNAIGKYTYSAYIYKESDLVAILSVPTMQLKASDKPKFDLIGGYTIKKVKDATTQLQPDMQKVNNNVLSAKIVKVDDANIDGAIESKFSDYFNLEDASSSEPTPLTNENRQIKAKSAVTGLEDNQVVYAYVTYEYEDLAGAKYYATKRVYFKVLP